MRVFPICSERGLVRRGVNGMRKYEVIYIIRPDLDEEKTAAVVERFSSLITNAGGELTKVAQWGKRRLQYEVKDFNEGFYVLTTFTGDEAVIPQELERVFKIADEIIRYLIVREEE